MNEYKLHYQELKRQGFELIRSNVGNRDFVHPKNKKYTVSFDWNKFKVYHESTQVYQTYDITEQLIVTVIQHIVDFKSSKKQFIESMNVKT